MLKFLLATILALGFPFMALADNNTSSSVGVINALATTNTNTRSLNGDTGNQIIATGTSQNSTTSVYTVSAGKTLYISSFTNNGYSFALAHDSCILEVTNSSGVVQYTLSEVQADTGGGSVPPVSVDSRSLPYPIKASATFIIKSVASATMYCSAAITGWEQ